MSNKQFIDWKALVPSGADAFFMEQCGSTNALAVDAGVKDVSGPCWFIAGSQTAGRGRRGRKWTSNQGNLFCSYMFRPFAKLTDISPLPFITSLAVRDMLIALGLHPEHVKCKWPNDVLVNEKKISGILIESSTSSGSKPEFIVIGIGINLKHRPETSVFPATSVLNEIGRNVEPEQAFKFLARNIHERLENWTIDSMANLVDEWSACAWGIGKRREIRAHSETFHATVMGLEHDGALNLRLDDGTAKRLYAGDVFGT